MSKQDNCASKALYEQQEKKISAQSDAMIKLLTKKGILEDRQIDDERIRQAQKEKKRNMYHNTQVLLENYRNIAWALATVNWKAVLKVSKNPGCYWTGSMRR